MNERDQNAPAAETTRCLRLRLGALRAIVILAFGAFLVYYGICCFRVHWAWDFQIHCAAVAELYRDLLSPMHETLNLPGTQSFAYTVYLVVVAALGNLFAATPYRALQYAGLFNISFYVLAICYLFSRYSIHRDFGLPAALFLFVSLFVRWNHFNWSSETSVLTFQSIPAYPSTLAWALAFMAFALLDHFLSDGRKRRLLGLLVIMWTLLLTHPLTASWTVGILGTRILYVLVQPSAGSRDRKRLVLAGLTILAAVTLTTLWPYFSWFGQMSLRGVKEAPPFGMNPIADQLNLYLLAAPCAAWLLFRMRRHYFWVVGLVATFFALRFLQWWGIDYANRYSFFMAFFAQLLVAEAAAAGVLAMLGLLPERIGGARVWRMDRALAGILAIATLITGLSSPVWIRGLRATPNGLSDPVKLLRGPSPHDAYYQRFAGFKDYLGRSDVLLMPTLFSTFDLASTTGAKVVAAPFTYSVPDHFDRSRDVKRFFATPRSAEGWEIVRRYGVTMVFVPRNHFNKLKAVSAMLGAPVYRDRSGALFEVQSRTPRE